MRADTYAQLPAGTSVILHPYGHGGTLVFATLTDQHGTAGFRDLTITAYLEAIRAPTMTRLTWLPANSDIRRHGIKATPATTLAHVVAAEHAWMVRCGYHVHERLRAHIDRSCLPFDGADQGPTEPPPQLPTHLLRSRRPTRRTQ